MELSDSSQSRVGKHESASDRESLGGVVSLYLRLWLYGGPSEPLSGLTPDQDPDIAELVRSIIFGKGSIAQRRPESLVVSFDNASQALFTARDLQQRFLTFQRKTEPHQVVPSILIAATRKESFLSTAGDTGSIAADLLANNTSAQILIAESVYELVKNSPGFKFNPKPVRESGGTGGKEAIYELLWTDESTYGHLRHASGQTSSSETMIMPARSVLKTVGRYQIQEELGRGAMGVVYKAHDELIGRTIALKTIEINRNTPDRDDLIERLKQEAKAAGGLDHPNIITIYDVGEEDDLIYLSMQFIEGKTLFKLLEEGALPPLATLISYAEQILSAVGFAHSRGVIHRDLKPANLMLTSQGVVKVLDFGIAKVENASLTQTGLVVGTPSHMAPEQVAGKRVDHRADIFALGSVFYELVTKEKPFRGDVTTILYKIMHEEPVAPSLINPAVPGGIDAIIRKALAKDPNERFQSCEEMREAFLEQAALLVVQPAQPTPAAVVPPKPATHPVPASAHYLLEELQPKRKSSYLWLNLALITALVIGAATVWAFYTKTNTGSFPPVVNKPLKALHRAPSTSQTGKAEQAAPEPNPGQDSSGGEAASTGAPSSVKPAAENVSAATTADNSNNSALQAPVNSAANNPPADSNHQSEPGVAVATSSAAPAGQTLSQAPASSSQVVDKNQPPAVSSPATPTTEQPKAPPSPNGDGSAASAEPAAKPPAKKAPLPPAMVEGFTRRDVPELLRQADVAAGKGDYRQARYAYNLILKLDPNNTAARASLRRLPAYDATAR